MKFSRELIKLIFLLLVVVVLYGFTQHRNKNRKLTSIEVEFVDESNPLITLNAVNKLLIQNANDVTDVAKETLDLKEAETRLINHVMVIDAQVFTTIKGVLGAKIKQRNPIGRVVASSRYYIDEEGEKMPLSSVYSVRVPLITGVSKTNFTELTPLLKKIRQDQFMKKSVVGLHLKEDGRLILEMRTHNFKIVFGHLDMIDRKVKNFKAFYQKAKKDAMLERYQTINLEFGNQVVATKK